MGEKDIIPERAQRVTWMTNPFDEFLRNSERSDWYSVDKEIFFNASRIVFKEGIITSCHYEGIRGRVPSFEDFMRYSKGKCEIDFLLKYNVQGLTGIVNVDSHINRNKMSSAVADRLTIKGIDYEDIFNASKYLGFPIDDLEVELRKEENVLDRVGNV